jgi:hypothetical protein
MVHDYSFFGSTADFVIKKEHLGFLPNSIHSSIVAILELIHGAQCLIEVIRSSGEKM